jgi:hypothetical protein
MDADRLAFVARLLGVVLFAAGIGGVVLGAYAPVQGEIGSCGGAILQVTEADTGENAADGLDFAALSPAEQRAFEAARRSTSEQALIEGPAADAPAFEAGTVVVYEGERYYAAIAARQECVSVSALAVALSIGAVALGAVVFVVPGLWRRFR